MRRSSVAAALVVMTAPLFAPLDAAAQIPGFYQLPKSDFVWNWGDAQKEGARHGIADIEARGSESSFTCELTAALRASVSMNPQEITQMETDLSTRIDFIYAVSEAMNYLDQNRRLQWAVLDCKKFEGKPVDEAESVERENRAREKMQRELDRRRARNASNGAGE